MASTFTYKLATSITKPRVIGTHTFNPGTIYTQNSFPMTKEISNAIANGTLVFNDSTSLSEHQGNVVTAAVAARDARSDGSRSASSTATAPQLKVAASITKPLNCGQWTFNPGQTYQDSAILMDDPYILNALARGLLTFVDSNAAGTVIGNPVVYQLVKDAHNQRGHFGTHNAFGA